MNFDTINTNPCVSGIGSGSGSGSGVPIDGRCSDAAFAAANPDICGSAPYLVLKPSSSLILKLSSIQFNVFLYTNGVENQVIDKLAFTSSDATIFVIGTASGSGTGLAPGQVVIQVTRNGLTASATVIVLDPAIGCSQTHVKTSILIDDSKSESLGFGGSYASRLAFARATASAYCGTITQVQGSPKDAVKVWSFDDAPTQISTDFISDTAQLRADVASVAQTLNNTDLAGAITAAANDLAAAVADIKVIILLSDGEQTDTPSESDILQAASLFKSAGGIIFCIGLRASGPGFDLLERIATGGFFLNATASNSSDVLGGLSYLKSAICAGACVPVGDSFAPTAALDYSSFRNWSVVGGQANLIGNGFLDFLPGNGLYVELSNSNHAAMLETIETFALSAGDVYEIKFDLAGNNRMPLLGQSVKVYIRDINASVGDPNLFEHVISVYWNQPFQTFSFSFTAAYAASVRVFFQQQSVAAIFGGNLLDNVFFTDLTTLVTLLEDTFDTENEVYTPPGCGLSAAIPQADTPAVAVLTELPAAASPMVFGDTYKYAYSYTTPVGETDLSPAVDNTGFGNIGNYQVRLAVTLPSSPVIGIRLWRNHSNGDTNTLRLLAVLPVDQSVYIDSETHAAFTARLDNAITPPVSNTTSRAAGALGFGVYGCYSDPCEPAIAIGAQMPDSSPLPNIETGSTGGGTTFTSTKEICKSCPNAGTLTQADTSLTPQSQTLAADGTVFVFSQEVILNQICYTFSISGSNPVNVGISGSNDGITWDVIIPLPTGGSASSGSLGTCSQKFTPSEYSQFKLVYNRSILTLTLSSFSQLIIQLTNQVCKSATATSTSSQSDADNKANTAAGQAVDAALAENCIHSFSSVKSYTASCPCGKYGQDVTKQASGVSLISQADADSIALAAAQAAATAALDCTLSNNAQLISIPAAGGQAAPYPSVKVVSGFVGNSTTITVKLAGVTCKDFSSFDILLRSPTGKFLGLKLNGGQVGSTISNFTLNFSDAAATTLPSGSQPANNGTYKPTQSGVYVNFPGCPSVQPWNTTLAQLAGESPNGSWSLWVRMDGAQPNPASIGSWDLTVV